MTQRVDYLSDGTIASDDALRKLSAAARVKRREPAPTLRDFVAGAAAMVRYPNSMGVGGEVVAQDESG